MKNRFRKTSVLFPIVAGTVLGGLLFLIGYTQDGPGACVIGLDIAFGLFILSLRNADVIRKGFVFPILLISYGIEVLFLSIVLFLDGELNGTFYPLFVGFTIGTLMLFIGLRFLFRRNNK